MEKRANFKIWNIIGMSVSDTDKAVEIKTPDQLAAMKDGQYVLSNDIVTNNAWTPVCGNSTPFTGKFYGAGHIVTVNGFAAGGTDVGLFGVVSGGLFRDLTVAYNDVVVNGATNVGGIAGQIQNGTNVLNCVVKGASDAKTLTLNQSGDNDACLGGITGKATNSFISNCHAGLNVKLSRSGGGIGKIGAVAGSTNSGSGGSISINISPSGTANNLAIDGVTVTANVSGITSGGALNIGGAVGYSSGNTVRNIVVSDSKVSFSRTVVTNSTVVGGVTGYVENSNMEACSFTSFADNAISGTVDNLNNTYAQLGGLIGYYTTNSSGNVYINNCLVRGNVKIDEGKHTEANNKSGMEIGGILGISYYTAGTVNITNSFFEDGNIEATCCYAESIHAGGFCGSFYEEGIVHSPDSHKINNCGVKAGTVTIDVIKYGQFINVGGFTSAVSLAGGTSNCFSRANVISRGSGNSNEVGTGTSIFYSHQTGGFAGFLDVGSSLKLCYATGTVQTEHSGNRDLSAGGLVGSSGGTIENCYALGNVLADKTGGSSNANAGGLVGLTYNGSVLNSFSAGQVIAQSKEGSAYAGGIVGFSNSQSIQKTAALGASVTASGNTKAARRILGSDSIGSSNYNYALNTMVIEEDAYNEVNPATRNATSSATGRDGLDVDRSNFFTQSFWSGTLGFLPASWDFNGVGKDGYPRLLNVGGQQ